MHIHDPRQGLDRGPDLGVDTEAAGERDLDLAFRQVENDGNAPAAADRLALEKLCWELAEIMKDNDDLLVMPICGNCVERVPLHSTGDQSSWATCPPTFKIV